MSYKILESVHGVSKITEDGVVGGVFDECSVSVVDKKVILAKGKVIVSGVSVLFDGREVIAIPDDYEDGTYYLVGVLKVDNRRPYEFYLSLRDNGEVKKEGYDGEKGVIECVIAEVVKGGDTITANRILPVKTSGNSENKKDFFLKKGYAKGDKLNILDAIDGYFPNFSIQGGRKYENGTNVGVGDFSIVSKTGNMFDVEGIEIRDIGRDDKQGFYVCPSNIFGVVSRIENGISAYGKDALSDEESRGVLNFYYGNLGTGSYYFFFKAMAKYICSFMEGENNFSVDVYVDGEKLKRVDSVTLEVTGVQKEISVPFTLSKDSIVEFKIYLHGHNAEFSDFCLSKGSKISYVDYGYDVKDVKIRDKEGNAYELLTTGYVSDEVTIDNGECVLIKRVKRGFPSDINARPYTWYVDGGTIGLTTNDGTIWDEGREVIYEIENYERIPLSDSVKKALESIRTFSQKTIVESEGSVATPVFSVFYYKDVY